MNWNQKATQGLFKYLDHLNEKRMEITTDQQARLIENDKRYQKILEVQNLIEKAKDLLGKIKNEPLVNMADFVQENCSDEVITVANISSYTLLSYVEESLSQELGNGNIKANKIIKEKQ